MLSLKSKTHEGEWEVITAKTLDDVEALRDNWQRLCSNQAGGGMNANIDRYVSVVRSMGEKARPYVILLRHNGRDAGMVVGRLEDRFVKMAIGYKTLARPALRTLSVVYGGLFCDGGEAMIRQILCGVQAGFERREFDLVYFNHLRTESEAFKVIQEWAGWLRRDHFTPVEPHWEMEVPTSMDAFYSSLSKATRKSLRRVLRTIEQEYGPGVERQVYDKAGQLEEMLSTVQSISSKTYQYAMGVGFKDSAEERIRSRDALDQGWLKVHVLRLGGEPVAFETEFTWRDTCFLTGGGYDPAKRSMSPGHALFLMVLDDISRTRRASKIDFGFGDAEYKHIYCRRSWPERDVYVFAAALKPVSINAARTLTALLACVCNWVAVRAGVVTRVKRMWRDWLSLNRRGRQAES